tara:strand:+ start:3488 stop:5176 length:1689 start_codon:yes stop_codon:yes gene_type:complete
MIKMNNLTEFEDSKLNLLIKKINEIGYTKAITDFLKNYPEYRYRFDKKEGNVAFRCINKNNKKCLVINSDLGNIPEFFSNIFDKVVSLDIPEKILIQKARLESKKINNIFLDICKPGYIPSIEKNFDLIIINGIQMENLRDDSKDKIKDYLSRIKNHLNDDGCLCLAIKNKEGITIVKEESSKNNFLDSFKGYNSLLNSLGLKIEPYWVLPSHMQAHYSAKLNDDVSLKWFFENFDKKFSVDSKFKIVGKALRLLNKSTRKAIITKYCPSFLFYCYKNEETDSLENMVLRKTKFNSIIQNSRMTKTLFFLMNDNGESKKVLTCKNTKYDFDEELIHVKREFPNMKNPDGKLVLEDWLNGDFLDRLNQEHIQLVMKWLIEFQKSTQSNELTDVEIDEELKQVRQEIMKINAMKELPYELWLDEYKNELKKTKLIKTAVHGDFQLRNILIDEELQRVNVIDWDWRFEEKGNPIYDFVWLATNIMMFSNNPEKEFLEYQKNGGKVKNSISIIKKMMENHFNTEFDLMKLQRFMIMRFITIRVKDEDDGYLLYVKILKNLENVKSY